MGQYREVSAVGVIRILQGENREGETRTRSKNNGSNFCKFDQNYILMEPPFLHDSI